MLLEIIKHTPTWVFILFFALLFLAYKQTKDREIKLQRIFILPTAMVLLSLFGIWSAFGTIKIVFLLWFIAAVLSLFIGLKLSFPRNVKYNEPKDVFCVPGSWLPMVFILIIFFIKYFVGVAVAMELSIVHELGFMFFISFFYGLLSGIFLSRSIVIMQSKAYKKVAN